MKAIAIIIVAGGLAALAGCSQNNGMLATDQATLSPSQGGVYATPANYDRTSAAAARPCPPGEDRNQVPWQFQDSDEAEATGVWYGMIGSPFGGTKPPAR